MPRESTISYKYICDNCLKAFNIGDEIWKIDSAFLKVGGKQGADLIHGIDDEAYYFHLACYDVFKGKVVQK